MLADAVAFLRGAAPRSGSAPAMYVFHDGWCYSQSAAVLAAHPTPELMGTFAIAAASLDAALARFRDPPTIAAGDEEGTLSLRSGRLRATQRLMYADPPTGLETRDSAWGAPAAGFVAALRAALPFVARQGTWQRGAKLAGDKVVAINGRSAIEVTVPGADLGEPVILGDESIAYVVGRDEPPDGIVTDLGAMSFRWPSGAWVRCQLINHEWPAAADRALDLVGDAAPIQITEDWRDALDDIIALGSSRVAIGPEGFSSTADFSKVDVELATCAKRVSQWAADALLPVLRCADRWDPDATAHAARFYGPNIRGLIAGVR